MLLGQVQLVAFIASAGDRLLTKYICIYIHVFRNVYVWFRVLAAEYYHLSGHINRISDILLPTARLVIVMRDFGLLTLLLLLRCHVNFVVKTTFNIDIRNGRMSTVFRKRVQHLPTAPHTPYRTTNQPLLINKIDHFSFQICKIHVSSFFQQMHAFTCVDMHENIQT